MFFTVLFCGTALAQVQKLGELSSGIFIDSAVIMEDDDSNVFGYCLLYQLDRKSKEVFDLEYVILDKNLNKLTSVSLTQAAFKMTLVKTRTELTFVKKIGNQLTVGVNDRKVNIDYYDVMAFFNYRFVNINLDTFAASKEYKYEGFKKKEYEYKTGDKMSFDDLYYLQQLISTKSDYFVSFAITEHNPEKLVATNPVTYNYKKHQEIKRFAVLDKDLKEVWSKNINADKKTALQYEYLDSDDEVLLMKKLFLKDKEALLSKSIEVYNIKTGALLGEIELDDKELEITLYSTGIIGDKLHVYTNAHQKSKKGWSQGYGHLVFDKKTVKETKRDFILWKDLASTIPGLTEYGGMGKDYGFAAQEFIITPKGTLLLVLEGYGFKSGYSPLKKVQSIYAQLKEMYLVEFDMDNKVVFSKKIEKQNSVEVYAGITREEMKKYGIFDYMFCQKINKDGDFVMYYTLNDQEGTKRKMAKKPLWTLGIISDVSGEYGFETLPLYGEDLKIYPGLAKNGYIRLLEVNQKTGQAEMRLEKVNY
ncbi:hypothetical protein AM493_08900 [Flavobacterium akiainvivens]|uniref:Uncharacterized protein n=2 Tax=Flavobacterium akiainvivens TaxID=1202724 RepID=A0A0M9VI00_9FLAO|nr:hypothetical protein AM493_08900 [Flavobacterium akiainvivens]